MGYPMFLMIFWKFPTIFQRFSINVLRRSSKLFQTDCSKDCWSLKISEDDRKMFWLYIDKFWLIQHWNMATCQQRYLHMWKISYRLQCKDTIFLSERNPKLVIHSCSYNDKITIYIECSRTQTAFVDDKMFYIFNEFFSILFNQLTGSDRSLMNAFREIGIMADRINLPRKIVVSTFLNKTCTKQHYYHLIYYQLEVSK